MQFSDIVVLALTSQRQGTEFEVRGWKQAGLPKPTWIKPVVATLSMSVISRRLGVLPEDDWKVAAHAISNLITERLRSPESYKG
jgi:hypothetical protein